MKTRLTALAIIAAAALAAFTPAQADTGWTEGRQANQRARIRDGVVNGDLTRREARQLRRQQRRVARLDERFGADGHYTRRERRRLDRALDRSSSRIARSRHNDRHRGGGGRPWGGGHRGGGHGQQEVHNTEVNNYYGSEQTETVESTPTFNRSFEVDFDGVRVIWNSSALY